MKQKTLFIVVSIILLLVFIVGTLRYTAEKEDQSAKWAVANREALVRMYSPTLGKEDAPVTIVEFFDPACETCKTFYPLVKDLMAQHSGKIRLVVRYAPFHEGSDGVVTVLEAARKQARFWPVLDALFASQAEWSPHHKPQMHLVWKQLEKLDLDLEKLQADMIAPEITRRIAQDLADAATLNVRMTPEFFVNGRPLPEFGYEPLKALVDEALAASAQ